MSALSLEYLGMRWLQLEKNCPFVLCERCPRYNCGEPDVLGVTKARHMIEIEIKRSRSDFAADSKKRHRVNYEVWQSQMPKYIYYLVPTELVEKVKPLTPYFAGLMSPGRERAGWLKIEKEAPENKLSKKLSLKECSKLARAITNFSIATHGQLETYLNRWKHGHYQYPEPDYEI